MNPFQALGATGVSPVLLEEQHGQDARGTHSNKTEAPLLQCQVIICLALLLAAAPGAQAQRARFAQRDPHIGYVYPAGGRQGADFQIAVGGQYLDGVAKVIVSGQGVEATLVKHTKPLSPKQISNVRNKFQEARKQLEESRKDGQKRRRPGDFMRIVEIAKEKGVRDEDLKAFLDFRRRRADPKRQLNPQLSETVTLQVKLAADAQPGRRELRLLTAAGLSNPLSFYVGRLPEYCENEPNNKEPDAGIQDSLPLVLNGQIMPGDVDRFSFKARKGQRLVVAAKARALMPYLADAVPGWFQATLALYDADGKEVAYADDYRFHPDPVLSYVIPNDGRYVLEIKDAIYRGREDFVYRVTLGEIPFVTSAFPMGSRHGTKTAVRLTGWNLPRESLTLSTNDKGPGVHPNPFGQQQRVSNRVPFAVDTLPECLEEEPNNNQATAQQLKPPLIVNGRIDRPGDWDVFRFAGRAGGRIVVEVEARRLNSPLDSVLKLTDADGRHLMVNDDYEDKGAGLLTHHADSRLLLALPKREVYYLHLGDAQNKGGTAYGYRLRVSAQRPDFELRVVPSSLNARAGQSVPITVYALRKDGFSGDIALRLKDAPPGFTLSGGWVPSGQDKMRLTLTAAPAPREEPYKLSLEGRAKIGGREIRRTAQPAEDMTQAFIYHHLVPAEDWMVAVTARGWRPRRPLELLGEQPVRLPVGQTAQVRMATPRRLPLDRLQFVLSEPPEGIAIENVSADGGGLEILLRANAEKVKPGLKGNLIVSIFLERVVGGRDGKQKGKKRRIPLGALPAISFETVAPH